MKYLGASFKEISWLEDEFVQRGLPHTHFFSLFPLPVGVVNKLEII